MIFYFTATGNSLYVARRLAASQSDRLVSIAAAIKDHRFSYEIGRDEKIGFVFPVYFYGIPTIVADFVAQLTITGQDDPFVFLVLTSGGKPPQTHRMFARQLQTRGYQLASSYFVAMPDIYILLYDLPDLPRQKSILNQAEKQVEQIIAEVEAETRGQFCSDKFRGGAINTFFGYPFYVKGRKTQKFYATDSCNGCGLCEEICPAEAIRLEAGRPVWVKPQCVFCLACLHRCPAQAIQYGKATAKRRRYLNPNVNDLP